LQSTLPNRAGEGGRRKGRQEIANPAISSGKDRQELLRPQLPVSRSQEEKRAALCSRQHHKE